MNKQGTGWEICLQHYHGTTDLHPEYTKEP